MSGLLGGATAYAGQSVEFRKSIEDAIPFSKTVFDMIHGDIPVVKKSVTPVEVDLSIPFVAEVYLWWWSNSHGNSWIILLFYLKFKKYILSTVSNQQESCSSLSLQS